MSIKRRQTVEYSGSPSNLAEQGPPQRPLQVAIIHKAVSDERGPLGLNLLHEPFEPLIDFVFVHGLGGGSRKTWSHEPSEADYYWPKAWLPQDNSFKNVRIHSFGYDSDYIKGRNSCWTIHHFSQSLLGSLRNSPPLSQADTPIVMIGHSMGGLVIKQAYMFARHDPSLESLRSRFQAIYFLATPHRGSDWAKILDRMLSALGVSRDFIEELRKGSGVLQNINEEFRHYHGHFEVVSFYEMNTMKVLGSRIVDPESGVLMWPGEKQVPVRADHRSICKFRSRTDPEFIELRNSLASTVKTISDGLADRNEKRRQSHLSELMGYLNISQTPDDDLEQAQSARLPSTCDWISRKDCYSKWKDFAAGAPTILWVNGKPATGKSVLAAYIIQELKQIHPNCSYYFFKHGEKSKSWLTSCFRSLAFQMARGDNKIQRALCGLQKELPELEAGSESSIWQRLFVSAIFRAQVTHHYWVIDGLDECEGSEAFIELLRGQLDNDISSKLKILITSRDTSDLKLAFGQLPPATLCDLHISTSDTAADIKTLIDAKSNGLTVENHLFRTSILERVLEKSRGSFLWTVLVLQELSKTYGEAALNTTLEEVPRDMNALYLRILNSMKCATTEKGRKEARAILMWVCYTTRPLSLEELNGALNLDLKDKFHAIEAMVFKLCGQLVTVDIFGKVQIVHESIREYLTSDSLKSEFSITTHEAHTRIAEVCLEYLTGDQMKPIALSRRGSTKASTTPAADPRIKFCSYACTSFSSHLGSAKAKRVGLLCLVARFLESNMLSWIEAIAQSKNLGPILEASRDFGIFLKQFETPQLRTEIQAVKAATADFVHLVAKYSAVLHALPTAIYNLIPPFCPPDSTVYKACMKSRTTRMSVNGLLHSQWDDRLACMYLHQDTYTAIAYGDELFAVGTRAGIVTLYHAASCQVYKLLDHEETPRLVRFKPKSDLLLTCGLKNVIMWNIRTGAPVYRFQAPFRPMAVAFSEDMLMVASSRNFVRSWDLSNNGASQTDKPWNQSNGDIRKPSHLQPAAITISTGHRKLAVAYSGQAICIWDLAYDEYFGSCGKRLANGEFTTHPVTSLAFNPHPDIPLLAVSYLDGELVLLDWFNGNELQSLRAGCRALTSSPNGRLLAGAVHSTIHVYEFETLRLLYRVKSSNLEVRELAFSHDNSYLADIRQAHCNIWQPVMPLQDIADDGQRETTEASVTEATTSDDEVKISALALHHQAQVLICGKEDGSVCLYDVRTGSELRTLYKHNTQVRLIVWQSHNNTIISADISNAIHACTLRKTPKAGWNCDTTLFDLRLDSPKAAVQLLPCETSNRLILATRESGHLWESDGKTVAVRLCTQKLGVKLWMQHPQSQLHVLCVEGATMRIFAWDDLTEVSSFDFLLDLRGLELKSIGTYKTGGKHRILLEMSELDRSSRTRGLHLIDATEGAFRTAPTADSGKSPEMDDAGKSYQAVHAIQSEKSPATEREFGAPLCGSRTAVFSRYVAHIIRLSETGRLIFLDTSSWVSSFSLEDLEMHTTHASGSGPAIEPPTAPISYSRHFFVPADWFSGRRDIVCAATMQDVFFARNGEVAVVRGGLDYSENIVVSAQ